MNPVCTANAFCKISMTWMGDVFAELGYSDPFLVALASAASALPGNAAAYWWMDTASRKRLLLVGMSGSALAAIGFSVFPVLAACAFSPFMTMAWSSLGVMSSEAFPVKSRATQLGLVVSFGRLGSILANAINPLLLQLHLILPVAGMAIVLGALLAARGLHNEQA